MRAAALILIVLTLSACGFHLRGREAVALPQQLRQLHVTMPGRMAYPPLLVEVRNALASQAGVRLARKGEAAPTLMLVGESLGVEPLSVNTLGQVTEHLLSYQVTFSLSGARGEVWLGQQSVKLQREYTYDSRNVLATEKQNDFLASEMRREAVQQILRRLAAADIAG